MQAMLQMDKIDIDKLKKAGNWTRSEKEGKEVKERI
jgi:hypothetical protein